MMIDIAELERGLATPGSPEILGAPDLAAIRRSGARRRRVRRSVVAGGVAAMAAVVVTAGLAWSEGSPVAGGEDSSVAAIETPPEPRELSRLAQRVLSEVTGASKVSRWQVVVPGPLEELPAMDEKLTDERFEGDPVTLPGRWYTGVTAYERSAFPGWLHDGVDRIEREELGDEEGHPVGSTDTGVVVDVGELELACMAAWDWEKRVTTDGACSPAVIGRVDGAPYYLWGMGTERFLEEEAPMELFSQENFVTGHATILWIGGLHGTDVSRVEFISDEGALDAEVAAGTLVPGESMFWADVSGELERVVAYDSGGAVIEDHRLRPCSDPVDCEVR